jgi:chemotaxis response regulator CheB
VPSTETRVEAAVALIYQSDALHTHLRDALTDLGATIVYEAATSAFDPKALAGSGARVVVVNLDPDSDEQLDAIDELLFDDSFKVVFNDGEVTSKLSGYDLARWARHLAAKVVGDAELLPPRPAGAEAVPVRSMPQHGLTTSSKPQSLDAPKVSDESMREATDAIATALASFDMHSTKLEAKNAPAPSRTDLDDLLGDFGLSTPAPSAGAPAGGANPFADLGLELDLADAGGDTTATPPAAAPAAAPAEMADELLAFADLNFDEVAAPPQPEVAGLDDFLAQHAPRVEAEGAAKAEKSAPKAPSQPASPKPSLLEGLTLSLEPEDAATPPAPAPTAAAAPAPAAAPIDFPFDLDGLSLEPLDVAEPAKPAPTPTAKPAAPPAAKATPKEAENPFDSLGFSLEPLESEAPAAAPAAPAKPAATPSAAVAPPAAAAPAEEASPFDALDFSFDDIPSGGPIAASAAAEPEPGMGDFGISLDETVELSFDAVTAKSGGAALDTSAEEDDFMREFAAMTASSAASAVVPATSGGAITRAWVLGASIGGPDAVREFLAAIPPDIKATFVLAQHMGADFVDLMVAQLQKATRLPVAMASSSMQAGHGQVLVVPIAERMLLEPSGDVRVVPLDDVSPYSPSIDRVLIDVADRFGQAAGAIIFSGMAHDAIEGAKHLAAKGGTVWVQDPSTCVVSSMIDGAMEAGIVSFIGTPTDLAAEFVRRFGKA